MEYLWSFNENNEIKFFYFVKCFGKRIIKWEYLFENLINGGNILIIWRKDFIGEWNV